jgi:hypothetical protein
MTATPRRVLCAATLLGVSSFVGRARAQVAEAVDANLALTRRDTGYGGDIRVGYRTGLGHASLVHTVIFQPELTVGAMHLPSLAPALHYEDQLRAGGGIRIGCLCGFDFTTNAFTLEPFAFGHVYTAFATDAEKIAGPGFLFDLGGALDVHVAAVSAGVHASYDHLNEKGRHSWPELGVHFEYRWFVD